MVNFNALLRYAWPSALSAMGSITIGLTDTAIMGHYSTEGLAGVSLGATIYELPINILLGGLVAQRIISPKLAGLSPHARETQSLAKALKWIAPWAVGFTICIAVVGVICGTAFGWSGQEGAAGNYLIARCPGLLAESATSALTIALVSWEHTRVPLQVFAISSGVNLLLDFVLVFGLGTLPPMGALGDGIASTLGNIAALLWVSNLCRREIKTHDTELTQATIHEQFARWGDLNLPSMSSAALDYAGNIVFIAIIAAAGINGLAASRAATFIHLLAFSLVSSLSTGALFLTGRWSATNGLDKGVHRLLVRYFAVAGVGIGLAIAILCWPLSLIISPDPSVQATTLVLTLIVAALSPLMALTYANVTMLRATGQTKSDFLSNTLSVWLAQVPLAAVGCMLFGAPGAFLGLAGYWLVRYIASSKQTITIEPSETRFDQAH